MISQSPSSTLSINFHQKLQYICLHNHITLTCYAQAENKNKFKRPKKHASVTI